MSMNTSNTSQLRRSEVWSSQLKDILTDELQAMNYVNWINEFPDGDTFIIPSIGQAEVRDYEEGEQITYTPMDTGQFTFQINQYKSSGASITRKAEQDGFYISQLVSQFVPQQERAIMESVEEDIMSLQAKQTSADLNLINTAPHRYVASGTNRDLSVTDFAKARYSLKMANVPDTDLVAIVDPSVEFTMNTQANLSNISYNPKWEGIVSSGIATGMRFMYNIYGFDVYTSNRLDEVASETIDSVTATNAKANMFFSAATGVQPFIGAWRQMPMVDEEFNKDFQRTEYAVTARWGVDLYRPENLITVLSEVNV